MNMDAATAELQSWEGSEEARAWDQDESYPHNRKASPPSGFPKRTRKHRSSSGFYSDSIEEYASTSGSIHVIPPPEEDDFQDGIIVESSEISSLLPPAAPVPPVVTALTGPIQLLNKILETWRLGEADATSLLGLEPSDRGYAADVLAGRTALSGRDAKDRLAYLIQIRMTLSAWLRDEEVENAWLREPQDPLGGKVPMQLLLEGPMENLLLVKEYVEAATGW